MECIKVNHTMKRHAMKDTILVLRGKGKDDKRMEGKGGKEIMWVSGNPFLAGIKQSENEVSN